MCVCVSIGVLEKLELVCVCVCVGVCVCMCVCRTFCFTKLGDDDGLLHFCTTDPSAMLKNKSQKPLFWIGPWGPWDYESCCLLEVQLDTPGMSRNDQAHVLA